MITQVLGSLQRKWLSLLVPKSQHFHLLGGKHGCLTPVPLWSSQAGSHRGSPLPCWSSHSCTGCWRRSTRSHHGRRWRTGQRRTRRGRHTCNSPGCCSRKRSHRPRGWSTRSHLSEERKKHLHGEGAWTRKMTRGEWSPRAYQFIK